MANLKSIMNARIGYDEWGRIVPTRAEPMREVMVTVNDHDPLAAFYCGKWYFYDGKEVWSYQSGHLHRDRLWRCPEMGEQVLHPYKNEVFAMSEYERIRSFEAAHDATYTIGGIVFRRDIVPLQYVGEKHSGRYSYYVRILEANPHSWVVKTTLVSGFRDSVSETHDETFDSFESAMTFVESHIGWLLS